MVACIRSFAVAALAVAPFFIPGIAHAQKPSGLPGNYPSKPIRAIINVAPGGGLDFSSRAVLARLGERWGSTIIMENVSSGIGGIVAMDMVQKSAPDGYTLLSTSGSTWLNAAFSGRVSYDVRKAFVPVAPYAKNALLIAINPNLPFSDLKGLLAYGKANPGKLSFGSSGVGSSLHLAGEMIQHMGGISMVHVPYKGTGQSVVDGIAGRIQVVIGSTTALVPHIRSGKMKSIGVTSLQRLPSLPDQPTLAESGLPGFEYTSWFGAVAPAGVPAPIITALNAEMVRIVNSPELTQLFLKQGTDTYAATPEQFREYANDGLDKVEVIIKATGIKLE